MKFVANVALETHAEANFLRIIAKIAQRFTYGFFDLLTNGTAYFIYWHVSLFTLRRIEANFQMRREIFQSYFIFISILGMDFK